MKMPAKLYSGFNPLFTGRDPQSGPLIVLLYLGSWFCCKVNPLANNLKSECTVHLRRIGQHCTLYASSFSVALRCCWSELTDALELNKINLKTETATLLAVIPITGDPGTISGQFPFSYKLGVVLWCRFICSSHYKSSR